MPEIGIKKFWNHRLENTKDELWKNNEGRSIVGKIVRPEVRGVGESKKRFVGIHRFLSIEIVIRLVIADPIIAHDEKPDDEAGNEPEYQDGSLFLVHGVIDVGKQSNR